MKIKASLAALSMMALSFFSASAQSSDDDLKLQYNMKSRKGQFSFYWGYNRSVYSNSTIHFHGDYYDFTVYDLVAHDRPTPLSWTYIRPTRLTIPQYVYRLGYNVTDRVQLSVGLDHMKYVMDGDQTALVSGIIKPEASTKYQGSYLNYPMTMSADFLRFEHSDGFNMVSLDAEYTLPLFSFARKTLRLNALGGIGGIFIVAKTNVKVLGYGLDNRFHQAGFTMNAKTGLKLEYKNRLFFVTAARGGYSSMYDVLIHNDAPDRAEHNVSYLEGYAALGTYFSFKKPKK